MALRGFRVPAAVASVLLVSGILSAAGTAHISRQYVRGAETLSLFEASVEVVAVSPTLQLLLSYHNPGPWPVSLLEVQVLAWHGSTYVGAASRDLRHNPLAIAPSSTGQLTIRFPAGQEPTPPPTRGETGAAWRFDLSGRLELPIMGAFTFTRQAVYHPRAEGS